MDPLNRRGEGILYTIAPSARTIDASIENPRHERSQDAFSKRHEESSPTAILNVLPPTTDRVIAKIRVTRLNSKWLIIGLTEIARICLVDKYLPP